METIKKLALTAFWLFLGILLAYVVFMVVGTDFLLEVYPWGFYQLALYVIWAIVILNAFTKR